MRFLIFNRPPGNFPRWGDIAGCVTHWIALHRRGRTISYPVIGSRGYATFFEATSASEFLELTKGNPLWSIEEYKIFILEEGDPMQEVPVVSGMQRFLVMARPLKPLPQKANIEGSRRHFMSLRETHGAAVYPLVQDEGVGMAIIVNVASHDELISLLNPNPMGSWGNFEVYPLATIEGERQSMIDSDIIRDTTASDPGIISVKEVLSGADRHVIIDIRQRHEWEQGHIPESVHVSADQLEVHLKNMPTGNDPVIVCRTGNRSLKAVKQLAKCDIVARSLDGGVNRWRAQGGGLRNTAGGVGEIV